MGFVLDVLMGRFLRAEAGRVFAERRLHRDVFQHCEKALAEYVINEVLKPKVGRDLVEVVRTIGYSRSRWV